MVGSLLIYSNICFIQKDPFFAQWNFTLLGGLSVTLWPLPLKTNSNGEGFISSLDDTTVITVQR